MLLSGFPGLGQLGLFSIAGLDRGRAGHAFRVASAAAAGHLRCALRRGLGPGSPRSRLRHSGCAAAHRCHGRLHSCYWARSAAALERRARELEPDRGQRTCARRTVAARYRRARRALPVVVDAADAGRRARGQRAVAVRLDASVEQGRLAGFETPAAFLPSSAAQRARQAAIPAARGFAREFARGATRVAVSRRIVRTVCERRRSRRNATSATSARASKAPRSR